MRYLVATTTVATKDDARRIARVLVEERLAACVQRLPIDSCYRWRNEVEESSEQLLIIKTTDQSFERLERRLRTLHPYELPELVALPVERGIGDYLDWIEESTGS